MRNQIKCVQIILKIVIVKKKKRKKRKKTSKREVMLNQAIKQNYSLFLFKKSCKREKLFQV